MLHVFSGEIDRKTAEELLAALQHAMPEWKTFGLTVGGLIQLHQVLHLIKMNIMEFDESEVHLFACHCENKSSKDVAQEIIAEYQKHSQVKAIELYPIGIFTNFELVLRELSEAAENVPIFGAVANPVINLDISELEAGFWDGTANFTEMAETVERDGYVVADEIIHDGFAVCFYCGEQMQVRMEYILGWESIGKGFTHHQKAWGDTTMTELVDVDGIPNYGIYRKYLGVYPGRGFVNNVSEFPLMHYRNGIPICKIPTLIGDKNHMVVLGEIGEEEPLYFGYANRRLLLDNTAQASNRMEKFGPQGLILVACTNRMLFLREERETEFCLFQRLVPNVSYYHGITELAAQNGQGGILNSTLIAVGFKEEPVASTRREPLYYSFVHENAEGKERLDRIMPLEDRLVELLKAMTSDYRDMAITAEKSNRAKTAFLSNMSHEIRTPINAVLGMDEMILRESHEDHVVEYAQNIKLAGNTLLGLINDILDFSKIEAGKLEIISVEYDLASTLNDLAILLDNRAREKGLELIFDVSPDIPHLLYGDEVRIKQIVTNLLTNAVKYTETGSITLRVYGRNRKADRLDLFISVQDTGIGIKPEDIEKLYNPFERIEEERNRTIEGTGLGMNITQELLRMMGSELKVSSVYGEGSTFYFSVPQRIVDSKPIGDLGEHLQTIRQQKAYREHFEAPTASILVVDDTPMNLTVICNLLKQTRIQIDTAESGEEALELVRMKAYDLILLDHRMPVMDGIQTLAAMKALEENQSKDAPVICLTANVVSGARETYQEAGFDDYLSKPVKPESLEEALLHYLPSEKCRRVDAKPVEQETLDLMLRMVELQRVSRLNVTKAVRQSGSAQLYLETLRAYYESGDRVQQEIRSFFDAKDIKNYTIKVHALKSTSRIIGAFRLGDLSEKLEAAGNAGDWNRIENDTDALLELHLGLLSHLESFFAEEEENTEDKEPILDEAFEEGLEAVREFAAIYDYESTNGILARLRSYQLSPQQKATVKRLQGALQNLSWEELQQ
ncbi:MAG: response regulator [Lachnospiraceae bacterium]|nr:response regulator [Lachnospiraceae bacterium]